MPVKEIEYRLDRLQDLRAGRGLTQSQLADKAGVSLSTVQKLERLIGTATYGVAIRLANALEVPSEELSLAAITDKWVSPLETTGDPA